MSTAKTYLVQVAAAAASIRAFVAERQGDDGVARVFRSDGRDTDSGLLLASDLRPILGAFLETCSEKARF